MITSTPSIKVYARTARLGERSLFEKTREKPEIGVYDLTLCLNRERILHRITMKVAAGEITALIGPQGSGKTVFLRCINRFNDMIPNVRVEGRVTIDGRNIYERHVDVMQLRRLVGFVAVRPNPFPMSVYDNVAYAAQFCNPLSQHSLDTMVEKALRQVDLWDGSELSRSRFALSLSPADRFRLCTARILVTQPKILLFDEPYNRPGLSEEGSIESLIVSLAAHYTILLATRDRKKVERIAQHCVVLQSGHIIAADVETEPPTNVLERPNPGLPEEPSYCEF